MRIISLVLCFSMFVVCPSQNRDQLVDILGLDRTFEYDVRYATADNFMKDTLYDCAKCLLRPEVAKALVRANQYFCEKGYRIKIFDCYRPLDIQKKMWERVPNPIYVANPYGDGSIHNKGAAVDITLVTLEGCYVEMGTDYDYFGRAAHIDFFGHPENVLANRRLLMQGMKLQGFNTIQSEWWHFSYAKNRLYSTLNEPLPCHE